MISAIYNFALTTGANRVIRGARIEHVCGDPTLSPEKDYAFGMRIVTAALEALKRPARVDIHTDSEYVQKGISGWINGWKRNGWRTSARQPVKNADLWQRLDAAQARHEVRWHWVRGHAGHAENERADELARQGMHPFLKRSP